ncbi:MAG: hypothetical protein ACJ73S_10270 [Mycobacteriales bacterium]
MGIDSLPAAVALHGDLLGLASLFLADPLLTRGRLAVLAHVAATGRQLGWTQPQIVARLAAELRLTPMAACRLYRCLTRQEAVATIAGLAEETGVTVPVTVADLDAWEAGRQRVPAVLVEAVCAAYRTCPDRIGCEGGR